MRIYIHYADLVSKFEKYDYDRIIQQYQRLWDLSPLLNHHPKYIPGIYFDLCLPSKDEQEFLQTFVCETGETERVLTEINNQASNRSKPNVAILSMAARQYLESREHKDVLIGERGVNCAGDHPTPQCEKDLEDYLRETGSAPELGENEGEGTPLGYESPPEGQQQAGERSAANQGLSPAAATPPAHDFLVVSTPTTSSRTPSPTPATFSRTPSPTPATSLTSSPTTSLSETVSLCEVTPGHQSEVLTSAGPPAQLVNPEWQTQINELMLRRRCFGFGPRGVLAILTKILQLLLNWKKTAGLGPTDRLQ